MEKFSGAKISKSAIIIQSNNEVQHVPAHILNKNVTGFEPGNSSF